MLTVVMVLCLAQSAPVKIAVPGLSLSGIETKLGEAYVERFATLLGRDPGLQVTTKRDIEQMLGLERQRQLLGCTENSLSCIAELAGGLGVEAVLSGTLAKTGSSYTLTLRVLRTNDGSDVASASERLKNEDALSDWLEAEAPRLAEKIRRAFGRSTTPVASAHVERWVPAMVGGALLLAGGGMQLGARLDAQRLQDGDVPLEETQSLVTGGKTLETASWVLMGVGVAGIAASVTWALVGGSEPRVAVVPMQGGAFVSIGGVLP